MSNGQFLYLVTVIGAFASFAVALMACRVTYARSRDPQYAKRAGF